VPVNEQQRELDQQMESHATLEKMRVENLQQATTGNPFMMIMMMTITQSLNQKLFVDINHFLKSDESDMNYQMKRQQKTQMIQNI